MKRIIKKINGFSIIELVIAIAIFTVVSGAIILLMLSNYDNSVKNEKILSAIELAEEGLEAARSIRDRNFLYLEAGTHGLTDENGYWEFRGNSNTFSNFYTRDIIVSHVYRDESAEIIIEEEEGEDIFDTFFEIENNEVTTTSETEVSISVLGASITSGPHDYPVRAKVKFNDVDFEWLYNGDDINNHAPPYTYTFSNVVGTGTTINLQGVSYLTHSTDDGSENTIALRNGDEPPYFEPFGDEPEIMSFLGPVMDSESGLVSIGPNDVLYLFELGHDDTEDPGFDMQDLVMLISFDSSPEALIEEEGLDRDVKQVISRVIWPHEDTYRKISLVTYLTNFRGIDLIDTLLPDFALGTFEKTVVMPDETPPDLNGSVVLQTSAISINNIETTNIDGQGIDVAVDGNYAYSIVDRANESFVVSDVTDPSNATIIDKLDIDNKGRSLALSGSYAFVTSTQDDHGLVVVDISDPHNTSVATNFNLSDNEGKNILIQGNIAYITTNNSDHGLFAVDISDPLAPIFRTSVNIYGEASNIHMKDNYLYVGVENGNQGLAVVDISTPDSPVFVTSLDINGEGFDIDSSSDYLFITVQDGNDGGLAVIDISTPSTPILSKFIETDFNLRGLALYDHYAYAAGDHPQNGLAVFDITYAPLTYLMGFIDIGARGSGAVQSGEHVFIANDTSNSGLSIFQGGSIITDRFEAAGEFTSQLFDTGSEESEYKGLYWEEVLSPTADIKIQIRTSDTLESMDNAKWVGSDGAIDTYYENPRVPLVLHSNPSGKRYIQYKAYLTGDTFSTPELKEVKINYE